MKTIHVVGLGPGDLDHMTLGTYRIMKNSKKVYVRTKIHPTIDRLVEQGISIESFDYLYEELSTFDGVYQSIAEILVEKAKRGEEVVFAVPGHPLFGEKTVEILKKILDNKQYKDNLKIHSSMSFLDAVICSLKIDPFEGLKIIDSFKIKEDPPNPKVGNIITQVYNRFIASEVKLCLMNTYDDEKSICLIRGSGVDGREEVQTIQLFELDRVEVDHLTTVYVPRDEVERLDNIDSLISIMEKLRSEEGCPWDRQQTHDSLKRYMIEEVYEVIDAIEKGDYHNLVEELGDLLLQIIFHCQIGRERGVFDLGDVIEGINNKLIFRHPHVFKSDVDYSAVEWEQLKKKEKGYSFQYQIMEDLPTSMPTLYLAEKVQKKAADVGFDWDVPEQSIDKVVEECEELKEALRCMKPEDVVEELGDLFFSVVNVSRLVKVDPDEALRKAVNKFVSRFKFVELELSKLNKTFGETDLDSMNKLWEKSKHKFS